MNHSMYSEGGGGGFDYPLMSTTNANFKKMQLLKVQANRPLTSKG